MIIITSLRGLGMILGGLKHSQNRSNNIYGSSMGHPMSLPQTGYKVSCTACVLSLS